MKISNISKNKQGIDINNTTSSMTVNLTQNGHVTVDQDEGKIGVVEKSRNVVSVHTENPTFEVKNGAAKMSVVMTPGLVGPIGPQGEPGRDGKDGVNFNFIEPISLLLSGDTVLSRFIDGETVENETTVLIQETLEVYRYNEGWSLVYNLKNNDIFQISRGNFFGGNMYEVRNQSLFLIKTTEINKWEIL